MKIKEFEIEKLYGKYTFKSQLDEKVNIIVGNNGTFKSTILSIIYTTLKRGHIYSGLLFGGPIHSYGKVKLVMNSSWNKDVIIYSAPKSYGQKQINDIDLNNISEYSGEEVDMPSHSKKIIIGDNEADELGESILKVDFISTFDIKDKDINTRETLLDKRVNQLQSDYGYYLNGLLKNLTRNLKVQGNVTKEDFDNIYVRKNLFVSLVNESFKETGKVIDNDADKLRFFIDNKTTIGADKLSSGEKQLLIILLTALLEDGQECILLMDEPEISLHISWQYKLIDWILQLNPNVQIILTTHSPMIFSDGWGDKAIHMEDITTKTRT